MAKLYNLARMTTATTGTGTITLGAAVSGYLTFALAGVQNGDVIDYAINDGANSEIGTATYSSTGPQLTGRTVTKSTNSDATINLSGAAEVFISPRAETLQRPPRGHIWGLTLANNATTPNTTIDIAAGEASSNDVSLPRLMIGGVFSKTTSAWAVGTGNGGLDTGSIAASTWYHVFQIMRSDTGVVDYLISTSASSPAMPSNYDHKRRIGSIKTNASSQIIGFQQYEDDFFWKAIVSENQTNAASEQTITLSSVPTGVRVIPFLAVNNVTSATTGVGTRLRSPDLMPVGAAPNPGGVPGGGWVVGMTNNVARVLGTMGGAVYTNTSAQLVIISDGTSGGSVNMNCSGWTDHRGRLS